jgi:hypothetical protein
MWTQLSGRLSEGIVSSSGVPLSTTSAKRSNEPFSFKTGSTSSNLAPIKARPSWPYNRSLSWLVSSHSKSAMAPLWSRMLRKAMMELGELSSTRRRERSAKSRVRTSSSNSTTLAWVSFFARSASFNARNNRQNNKAEAAMASAV